MKTTVTLNSGKHSCNYTTVTIQQQKKTHLLIRGARPKQKLAMLKQK